VADIPHQTVIRRIEDVMQGDGQFDHPEARAEMPAGLADRVEQVLAQFVGQGFQLGLAQTAQLIRRIRAVEQGRQWAFARNLVEGRRNQADRYRCKRCGSLPEASETAQTSCVVRSPDAIRGGGPEFPRIASGLR
jgi:hypothetical protein